jgi:hypothetical protein
MSEVPKDDFLAKKKQYFKPDSMSLRTNDIEGAQPYLPGYKYVNKPSFYAIDDIEKASPQPRHRSLNKPSTNLQTSDIPNASPNALQFRTTRKDHDPLNPVYKLPTFEVKPSTPPRFLRDATSIDDIEGCRPSVYSKWKTRINDLSDIPGAKAQTKRLLNKPDLNNPRDINTIEVFESKRVTNPLMPEYVCRDENGMIVMLGQVSGSQPRKTVDLGKSPHNRHLSTSDIEGATAGSKGNGPIGTKLRNYIRSPNDTNDIDGAQAGSFKKGISTLRATNPLDPSYTWMTTDPEDQPPLPKPEAITTDKSYLKNNAQFWGASNKPSRTASSASSDISSVQPLKSEIQRNAKRFFGHETSTPNTLQQEFSKNASKFYESQGKVVQNYLPSGTIHRSKVFKKPIDEESESYKVNAKNFFFAQTPADASVRSVQGSDSQSYKENAKKFFYGGTPASSAPDKANRSSGPVDRKDYRFGLSREDIGKTSGFN